MGKVEAGQGSLQRRSRACWGHGACSLQHPTRAPPAPGMQGLTQAPCPTSCWSGFIPGILKQRETATLEVMFSSLFGQERPSTYHPDRGPGVRRGCPVTRENAARSLVSNRNTHTRRSEVRGGRFPPGERADGERAFEGLCPSRVEDAAAGGGRRWGAREERGGGEECRQEGDGGGPWMTSTGQSCLHRLVSHLEEGGGASPAQVGLRDRELLPQAPAAARKSCIQRWNSLPARGVQAP